jgi:protein-S-isoprenylcysteine O-methyltransferase Ste14
MRENPQHRLLLAGTIAAYLLIGLEVFIMITPFTLYFYAVYGPVLEWLTASPATAWLMEFFLPHLVFVNDPLIKWLSDLQIPFIVGLLLFFLAAIPLYYGRLTNKGVVRFSPYAKLRHPQYLFLAISGLGMLLYWPRFIVLIF